jgi:large subunit ribosomal protein L9
MPKTEIILTHNVVGLGAESDQVKVAAGYARNYLFPQGLAIPLTAANKRRLEALRQRRAEREAHEFNTMSELSKSLSKMVLVLAAKTGEEGKMFGSITAGVIVDELKHQFDIAIDQKKVHLERPLRAAGEHEVELRLHPEVVTTLKVRVESTTLVAKPAEAPAAEPRAKEAVARRTREPAPGKTGEIAAAKGKEGGAAKAKDTAPAKTEAPRERPTRKPKAEKKAE